MGRPVGNSTHVIGVVEFSPRARGASKRCAVGAETGSAARSAARCAVGTAAICAAPQKNVIFFNLLIIFSEVLQKPSLKIIKKFKKNHFF
jgi:hypothetical protein